MDGWAHYPGEVLHLQADFMRQLARYLAKHQDKNTSISVADCTDGAGALMALVEVEAIWLSFCFFFAVNSSFAWLRAADNRFFVRGQDR